MILAVSAILSPHLQLDTRFSQSSTIYKAEKYCSHIVRVICNDADLQDETSQNWLAMILLASGPQNETWFKNEFCIVYMDQALVSHLS